MIIVKTAGKSVFYRSCYEAVVKYITDLITEDGNLMTHFMFSIYGFYTLFPLDGKRNSRIATRKMKLMTAKLRSLIHKIFQGGGRRGLLETEKPHRKSPKTERNLGQNRNESPH